MSDIQKKMSHSWRRKVFLSAILIEGSSRRGGKRKKVLPWRGGWEKKVFFMGYFERRIEPKRVKEKEGSSLEWGVGEVLRKMKRIPDFIYDGGDVGKEPMIRVLGKNPEEVVNKIIKIAD